MPTKQSISQMKYDKTHTRYYGLKLVLTTDADIIEKLASVPSMQGYIKKLIREDIARTAPELKEEEEKMKTYIIKPEYIDNFGSDANAYTVLTEDDIRTYSEDFEKTEEEIRSMLIEDDTSKHCYRVLYRVPCEKKYFTWEHINDFIAFESGDSAPFFETEEDFNKAIKDGFVTYDLYYVTIWVDD